MSASDPVDPLFQMLRGAASSIAARHAAISLAALQAEHFRQLKAEGLEDEAAVMLTAQTSQGLFAAIGGLMEHAPAIAEAVKMFVDVDRPGEGESGNGT